MTIDRLVSSQPPAPFFVSLSYYLLHAVLNLLASSRRSLTPTCFPSNYHILPTTLEFVEYYKAFARPCVDLQIFFAAKKASTGWMDKERLLQSARMTLLIVALFETWAQNERYLLIVADSWSRKPSYILRNLSDIVSSLEVEAT